MSSLDQFNKVDVYLLDQYFKGNFHKQLSILDIGCGKGRNSIPFINNGFNIDLVDPTCNIPEEYLNSFEEADIQTYNPRKKYNFIICNAVLHFCNSTDEFLDDFNRICSWLQPGGVLFIRMTSDFGIDTQQELGEGRYVLKDGTTRFLLNKELLNKIISNNNLIKVEPVKTSLVEDLRAMTTLVLSRKK